MSLPSAFQNEINALSREVLKEKPSDVLQFCANFFNKRLESQRAEFLLQRQQSTPRGSTGNMAETTFPGAGGASSNPFGGSGATVFESKSKGALGGTHQILEEEEEEHDTVTSPTNQRFGGDGGSDDPSGTFGNFQGFGGGNGGSTFSPVGGSRGGPPSAYREPANTGSEGYPSNYALGRRTSVSAESMNPTAALNDNWTPPHHAKSDEQLARLKSAVSGNFLFSHLDDEQSSKVLGALVEKVIPAKDIKVITQGDVGDYFYVIEKGAFDVYIHPSGHFQPGDDGLGNKVTSIGPGGSFGELALMYNAPRAATVISTEPSTLWALDRVTFRRILMDSAFRRRRMYENFLEEVPLLEGLTPYERSKIADALDTQKFPAGTTIIKEGDPGEAFFILESGEAEVYKRGKEGPIHRYKKGDYFGELALLNDAPRAASVISKTEVKVATLGKDGFQRLLGPVEELMRRNDPSKQDHDDVDPLNTSK